jgi:hypothetical protein
MKKREHVLLILLISVPTVAFSIALVLLRQQEKGYAEEAAHHADLMAPPSPYREYVHEGQTLTWAQVQEAVKDLGGRCYMPPPTHALLGTNRHKIVKTNGLMYVRLDGGLVRVVKTNGTWMTTDQDHNNRFENIGTNAPNCQP